MDSHEFEVDFYLSDKILKQLQITEKFGIFKSSESKILQQLALKNYDLVIIGTVHRYFSTFYKIVERYNTSVIVHNTNFGSLSKFQLFKKIFRKDFPYRLKLFLEEGLMKAPNVHRKAGNLLVLDKALLQGNYKFITVFFNKFSGNKSNDHLTLVIPGAVSQSRRDYRHVLKKLEELRHKNLNQKIRIVLLGKIQGEELSWFHSFDELSLQNIELEYFTEKVPQEVFDFWMNNADVLWCPIQNETEFFSTKEIYGKTKMTGNIGDAIKYGKPAVFPSSYTQNYEFIINENENLWEQFLNMKQAGFPGLKSFEKDKISAHLHHKLRELITFQNS